VSPDRDPAADQAAGAHRSAAGAHPPPETVSPPAAVDAALDRLLRAHALPTALAPRFGTLLQLLAARDAPTSVHDPAHAVDVHVADSLAGLAVPELRASRRLADLGAGAGLPGLPLAIALPEARVVLVESQRRKCAFLEHAVAALALTNVGIACARAEEVEPATFDVVTARALAALPILCEYAAPLLAPDGVLVAWKGAVDAAEDADGLVAAAALGLEREAVRPVEPYAGSERRTLHVFRKIAPTPVGYPRRPGMAAKRPLRAASSA
jgi:16S rRNA (guanine527-N7)-methyltransferase